MPIRAMPLLSSVQAKIPTEDWEARAFSYETQTGQSSHDTFETGARRAVIYLARSRDRKESSVDYQSSENSGWHGKCIWNDNVILLSFNAKGEGFPLRSTLCQRVDDVYLGYDYASRPVRLVPLRNVWQVDRNNEWQVVGTVPVS